MSYERVFNPANVYDIDGEFGEIYIPPAAIAAQQFQRIGNEAVTRSFDALLGEVDARADEA